MRATLIVLVLFGCGGSTPRSAEPPLPTSPPAAAEEGVLTEEISVLDDRLRLRFPNGYAAVSDTPSVAREEGELTFTFREHHASAPAGYDFIAATETYQWGEARRVDGVESGIAVYETPNSIDVPGRPLLGLWFVHPADSMVIHAAAFVSDDSEVDHDSARELARAIARTVVAGDARVPLPARTLALETLAGTIEVDVPEGYYVSESLLEPEQSSHELRGPHRFGMAGTTIVIIVASTDRGRWDHSNDNPGCTERVDRATFLGVDAERELHDCSGENFEHVERRRAPIGTHFGEVSLSAYEPNTGRELSGIADSMRVRR